MSDLHNQFTSELYNRFNRFKEQMREQKGEVITRMRVHNHRDEFIDCMKRREDDSKES
jgi:nitrogen fixation/metabolism regulation signal transduction histidine kinase